VFVREAAGDMVAREALGKELGEAVEEACSLDTVGAGEMEENLDVEKVLEESGLWEEEGEMDEKGVEEWVPRGDPLARENVELGEKVGIVLKETLVV